MCSLRRQRSGRRPARPSRAALAPTLARTSGGGEAARVQSQAAALWPLLDFFEILLDAIEVFVMLDCSGMFFGPDEVFEMLGFIEMSLDPVKDLDFVLFCDRVASHTRQNYIHRC